MGQVRVGTASWTDRTLIASGWYPPQADTPEKRLRYYARQFPLVEVDATYYALPAAATAQAWAARTERKLGAILLQFPPWFPISKARKDYIVACAERAAPDRVCIEFRNRTWMTPANQDETLGFLGAHQLPYVCVDMPQGHRDSIPPVLAATAPDLAVVRLHGHSDKWDSKDIHERFGYRYTDAELAEWAAKVHTLARDARQTHVLFNNCYRNYAQVNAQQLAALLQT